MARRLNKRLLVYLLIFVGVPGVFIVALASKLLETTDWRRSFEEAKGLNEKQEWPAAWIAIRKAIKDGGAKDPDVQFLLAQIAMHQNPPAGSTAINADRAALAARPDFVEAQRHLALLYFRARYLKEAQTEIDRLIQMDPGFGEAYLWAAGVEMVLADAEPIQTRKMPHFQQAIARCQAGIAKVPDMMDLYRVLATAYERAGDTKKVDEVLDLAVANNPKSPDAYNMKAGRLLQINKSDDAVKILKTGLEKAGENPGLYMALGEIAMRQKKLDDSQQYLAKALQLDPKNEGGYLRLSGLYRADNERDKALAAVQQGLTQLPDSVPLKGEEADLYLDLGNFPKAEGLMVELAKAKPDLPLVNYLRGKRAMMGGQTRQAIAYLEESCEKQPTPQGRLLLARAYVIADELGAAKRVLDSLLGEQRGLVSAWQTAAEVNFRLRELDEASRAARVVLASYPDDVKMRMLLAQALLLRQRPADALKEAQAAADRTKGTPEPYLLMADIYQEMRRPAEAERALLQAVSVAKKSGRVYQRYVAFLKDSGQEDKLKAFLDEAKKVLTEDEYLFLGGSAAEMEKILKPRADKEGANTADLLNLARLYQLSDRSDDARTYLRKVLAKADSKGADWRQAWQQLFLLELSNDKYDKAAELVTQLKAVDPQAIELLFADPLISLSQGNLDQAAEQLRAVAATHKTLSHAQYLLGQVLLRQRKGDDALAALGLALELRPQLLPARLLRARIYMTQGNFQAALGEAAEALRFDPHLVSALELKAAAQAGMGAWAEAAAAREEIARLVPDSSGNLISLAALYLQRHQPEKAEDVFRRAYALVPDSPLLVRGYAEFYLETGRMKQGEKIVDDYVARHKDEANAYIVRAEFAARAAGPAEAEKYYRKAAELDPKNSAPLMFLGDQYSRIGQWAAAATAYVQAIERAPANPIIKRRLADVYMLQNKLPEAKAVIDEVLRADPRDAAALVVAGRIASRQDRADDARKDIEKALAIDPNYGEAKVRLADLYAGPDPMKALDLLARIDPADPAFEKAMLLRADINTRRVLLTDAILDLRRLLDFRPTSVPGRLTLASKYMAIREPAKAAEIFQQLSRERMNQDPLLLALLADSLLFQGKYDVALKTYEEARAIRPESSEALVGEAKCLVALKRPGEAIDRIHRVMNVLPNEVWPRIALAAVHERMGDLPKAVETVQTGLLRRGDWESGYVLLADLLDLVKQPDQARQALVTGLAKLPKSILIRAKLATREVQAGRPDSARQILEPVATDFAAQYGTSPDKLDRLRPYFFPIRIYSLSLYNLGQVQEALNWGMRLYALDPTDVANGNNMAWILATAYKDYGRAGDLIAQCMRLMPNHPQVLDTAGWIAFLGGKYGDAADYFLASIKYGDNPEAHYHMGRLMEAQERLKEAREEYAKAVQMGISIRDRDDVQKRLARLPAP